MLTVKDINPDKYLSVYISVTFAKEVLPIFEEEHPEVLGPRKAIEVAEAYLRGEEVSAASAYDAASASAYAGSAGSAVYYVASSAFYAASASASVSAADSASAFAYANAVNAARTAAYANAINAARTAAFAASNREEYIHERLLKMLSYILQYKINNQQSFGNPEKVFEYLNEEKQKDLFLFNLDIWR